MLYTIGQASAMIDIPIKTIRCYESIGLCSPSVTAFRSIAKDMGYFHPCSAYPMSDLTIEVFTRLG